MTEPSESIGRLQRFFATGRRLAVCGPSGVGKTTLAALISGLTGATVHHEGARDWLLAHDIERYWEMQPQTVADMQMWLLESLERSTAQIFDRFSADAVVFAERARASLDFEAFEARAREMALTIDLVVFMPYRSELLVNDGVRRPDPMYQLRASGRLLDVLHDWGMEQRTVVYAHHRSLLANLDSAVGLMTSKGTATSQ